MFFFQVLEAGGFWIVDGREDATGARYFSGKRFLKPLAQATRLVGKKRFQRGSLRPGIGLEKGKVLVRQWDRDRGHGFLFNPFPCSQQVERLNSSASAPLLIRFFHAAKEPRKRRPNPRLCECGCASTPGGVKTTSPARVCASFVPGTRSNGLSGCQRGIFRRSHCIGPPPPNFVPIARKGSHDWWDIHGPTKFSGDWWTTRHWPDRHSREFPLHHRQVFG